MTVRRLVVFDLDGTLVDSRADLATSVNVLLTRRGATPLPVDLVTSMVGEGARLLLERAFAAAALPPPREADLAEFLVVYDTHLVDVTAPYPGVADLLRDASRVATLALVTNKPEAPSRRLLSHFGLDGFLGEIRGGDSPFGRKPSPAALLDVMRRTGAAPADTILVGDSRIDLATARAAPVRFCLARYGFGAAGVDAGDLLPGDWTINAPLELLPLVAATSRARQRSVSRRDVVVPRPRHRR
jgi:phosphoglycolate phosphatase